MKPSATIGQMRHRVELQKRNDRAANDDAIGGFADEWETKSKHWARVQPVSGLEAIRADQLEGIVSHKVTTRYIRDISPADRFRYDGRVLNIVSVVNVDEAERFTVCQVSEVIT